MKSGGLFYNGWELLMANSSLGKGGLLHDAVDSWGRPVVGLRAQLDGASYLVSVDTNSSHGYNMCT